MLDTACWKHSDHLFHHSVAVFSATSQLCPSLVNKKSDPSGQEAPNQRVLRFFFINSHTYQRTDLPCFLSHLKNSKALCPEVYATTMRKQEVRR
jgi:hypothetical protein